METRKKETKSIKKIDKARKNRRIIIGFCASFMTLVLIFGAVLVTVLTVNDKNAVVKYNGVLVDKGVASYLTATCKYDFMKYLDGIGVDAYDTESFWMRKGEGDETYGDMLKRETELYIKSVVIGAYLFDRYSSLSSEDKETISKNISEVLDYKAENSRECFDELASPMGFDYDDFSDGVELVYKASKAQSEIYGQGGSVLASGEFSEECGRYYDTYSHAKILYITTSRCIVKNDKGEIELDSDDKILTRLLTDDEVDERREDIAEIRALIDGYNNDSDVQMSPEYFETMQKKYNFDNSNIDTGYYFSDESTYTARFPTDTAKLFNESIENGLREQLTDATELIRTMKNGEYAEIGGEFGICFVYKYENEPYAYQLGTYSAFFHDFYENAASYLYRETLEGLSGGVEIRDGYYEIDPITLPYNHLF